MNSFSFPLADIGDETYLQWLHMLAEAIDTKSLHLLNMMFGTDYPTTNINVSTEIDSFKGEITFTLKRNSTGWGKTESKGSINRIRDRERNEEAESEHKSLAKSLKTKNVASVNAFYNKFSAAYCEYNKEVVEHQKLVLSNLYKNRRKLNKEMLNE